MTDERDLRFPEALGAASAGKPLIVPVPDADRVAHEGRLGPTPDREPAAVPADGGATAASQSPGVVERVADAGGRPGDGDAPAAPDLSSLAAATARPPAADDGAPPLERMGRLAERVRRHALMWVLVACVLCFIAWSLVFQLDVASYAQGQVIPAGQLKRIQHLEGGIVREIRVVEGQQVATGAVIAELEDVVATSDVGDLRSRMASLEIKAARISACLERAGSLRLPPELESEFPAMVSDARSAFGACRERYQAMLRNHESRIAQRRAEIEQARQQLAGLQSRSQFVAEQVRISTAMLKEKLTHEYEHLQLKKEQAQIDADRNATTANLERAQTALAEASSALEAFRGEEDVNLRKDLLETRTELNSLRERMKKPTDSQERTVVRSPVAGTVMTLYFKNRGAVVSPGGTIATLVPDGEALLVEAKLPIGEVGYVHVGARARLSIASGGVGFSTIDARVVHISPDAAMDDKTGASFYIVRLEPAETAFRRGDDRYALRPGVQVMAAIITGARPVMSLLVEPFVGSGIRPLTER